MSALPLPPLLLVTDRRRTAGRDLAEVVARAFAGGVRFVQIREKDLPEAAVARLLDAVRSSAPPGATIVVNGRAELARERGIGLHLPAGVPRGELRGIAWFGRSAHLPDEIASAAAEGAAYVVVGTVFPTPSKPGTPGCGIAALRRWIAEAPPIPVYAIGGIDRTRAAEAMGAGAAGIAVCGAILGAADPAESARALVAAAEGRAVRGSGSG